MKNHSLAIVLVALLALAPASARAATLVLPRSGQVGIGVQGQYGTFFNSGELGNEFGNGGGVAVRLRYRMRYERGIGLSFEEQLMDTRSPRSDKSAFLASTDALTRSSLEVVTEAFDVYQFFGTRTKNTKYLSATLGMAQVSGKLSDGETVYPPDGNDGMLLGVGAGWERFVYRSWAIDASARYQVLFFDSQANQSVHLALGMIFYAAY